MNVKDEPILNSGGEIEELRQRVAELEHSETERLLKEQVAVDTQRKRDLQTILFLAASPLLLEVFLFVLNRSYMSTLFQGPNLPYGMVLQGAVIILALISFFTLRSSVAILRSERVILGWAMGFVSFVLFLIPAWILVFLTPAALILIQSPLF